MTSGRGALRNLQSVRRFSRSMDWNPLMLMPKSVPMTMPIPTPMPIPMLSRVGRRRFTSLVQAGGSGGGLGVENVLVDESTKKSPGAGVHHNNTGSQFLDDAVAEGHRVLEFCHGGKVNAIHHQQDKKSPITKEKLQELEIIVDRFLQATMATVPLSQAMAVTSRDDEDANKERVKILHGAFLSLALKCITTLMQDGVEGGTTTMAREEAMWSSPPPPLLDKVLQLVTRARKDLNLPCPLPVYQWLAVMVAQTSDSSSTITKWILQAGQWARDDFGMESIYQEPQEFFAQPLYHLAQRKRYGEMVDILLVVLETESFARKYLKEDSLKQVLSAMQGDLETHLWNSSSKAAPKSQAANALLQVLLLLEPSIWFVFGYSSSSLVSETRSLQFTGIESLKGAIAEILSGENNDDDDSLNLRSAAAFLAESNTLIQALFPDAFREDLDGSNDDLDDDNDDDDDDEDDDDDDDDDNRIYHPPKGSWEIILDMDSDMAIVGINRIRNVDQEGDADSDDDDDNLSQTTQWDTRELYTRSLLHGTLPDVVQQLEQVVGRPLQYSKQLEHDLIRTMRSYDV